jgi:hypothetical protein
MRRFLLVILIGFVSSPNRDIGQQLPTASGLLSKVHDVYRNLKEYKLVAASPFENRIRPDGN